MQYSYFENEGNMHTYFYNTLDDNYLKFALLTSQQYNKIKVSNSYTDAFTSLLDSYSIPTISQEDGNQISFDNTQLSLLAKGDYYLVAYYEKEVGSNLSGASSNAYYVIRLSDNVIKLNKNNGVFTKYSGLIDLYEPLDSESLDF